MVSYWSYKESILAYHALPQRNYKHNIALNFNETNVELNYKNEDSLDMEKSNKEETQIQVYEPKSTDQNSFDDYYSCSEDENEEKDRALRLQSLKESFEKIYSKEENDDYKNLNSEHWQKNACRY